MLNKDDMTGMVTSVIQEAQFTERNTWITKSRALINREQEPKIPGLEELQLGFHSPKLKKDGHAYTNKLIAAPMHVEVAAQVSASGAETNTAQDRAQRLENLFYRVYAKWKAEGHLTRAIFDMVTLKRGHLHMFVNRDVLPLVPQQEKGESDSSYLERAKPILAEFEKGERSDLFQVEHVAPDTVYWTPDRSHKIIAALVPLNPLCKQYLGSGAGGYLGEPGKGKRISYNKATGTVEVQIINTADGTAPDAGDGDWAHKVLLYIIESNEYIYHYLADGVSDAPNKRGELIGCYKNVFGAPAIVDFNGEPTGQDHALHGHSALIEGLYETEPLVNALGKLIMSAAIEAAQQQRTLKPAAGDAASELRRKGEAVAPEVRLLQNKWRLLPDGYDLSEYTDELPTDVLNAWTTLLKEREDQGFPRVLAAPEELDATSGYDRAKATDAVSSQLDPPLERIGNGVTELFRLYATGIKEVGIDLPVRNLHPTSKLGAVPRHVQEEITVTPEDIVDSDISVGFDSKSQYARLAETEEGIKLMQIDLKSETQVMRDMGYDDPERVRKEIDRDKMRKLARDAALKDSQALFQKLRPIVEGESITENGLDGMVGAARAAAEAERQQAAQAAAMGQPPMDPAAPMVPPEVAPMPAAAQAARMPMNEPAPPMMAELGGP